MKAGGTTPGRSGYAAFHVLSRARTGYADGASYPRASSELIYFQGAERCSATTARQLSFPVNPSGAIFPKNGPTPRTKGTFVVYLDDGETLCGVVELTGPVGEEREVCQHSLCICD